MTKKINLRTKSLYMGILDNENESHGSFFHFIYSSQADDDDIEKYFRNVVYKGEYGEKPDKDTLIDIYEIREGRDYLREKNYKIIVTS